MFNYNANSSSKAFTTNTSLNAQVQCIHNR